VLILAVTLFTPAESREQLRKFYEKCRPPGLWGPVAEEFPTEARRRIHREFRGDLVSCFIGIVLCAGMVVTLNAVVAGAWLLALVAATCALASGLLFIHRWKTRNRTSESDLSPQQVNR
jgi:Flp pilus assembly protein TadB